MSTNSMKNNLKELRVESIKINYVSLVFISNALSQNICFVGVHEASDAETCQVRKNNP